MSNDYSKPNQAFDDVLKNFVGYDSEGNIILGDSSTGEFQALDKGDFEGVYKYAETRMDKNKKFEDSFSDYQAKQITKDKQYLGQDKQGNSVFKNNYGIIERAKGSFSEGLKRQFGDQAFTKENLGVKNQVENENKFLSSNVRAGVGSSSNLANINKTGVGSFDFKKPPTAMSMSDKVSSNKPEISQNKIPPKKTTPVLKPKVAKPKPQQQQAPSLVNRAVASLQQKVMDKGQAYVQNNVLNPALNKVENKAQQLSQPYVDQAKTQANSFIDPYKNQAKALQSQYMTPENKALLDQGKGVLSGAQALQSVLKDPSKIGDVAKSFASGAGQDMLNQYMSPELKEMFGSGQSYLSMAKNAQSLINDPSQLANVGKNIATDYAKSAAGDFLNQNLGSVGGAAGVQALSSLLKGGNVVNNLKSSAGDVAKGVGKDLLTQGLSSAGANAIPGGAGALLSAGKALSGSGNSRAKGQAAAQAAAKAAMASATGGLVTPESLDLAAGLSNKAAQMTDKLGVAGTPAKLAATLGGAQLKGASELSKAGLNVIGDAGANFFGNYSDTFKNSKDAIKKITSGNISEGAKELSSTGLKSVLNTLVSQPKEVVKNIVSNVGGALGNIGSSIGKAVSSIFCFTEDTMVLMEDNSVKKIKDIQVGDRVKLGGLVVLVSHGLNQDIHDYNGVKVSGGHGVLEDGVWKRVKDTKAAVRLDNESMTMVYTLATENHLIMTEDFQVWLDVEEVQDTFNKTDDDILKELNSKKKLNKILETKTRELKE